MFHACQRDAGIAFSDMVKEYLCLHRGGLSDDQRAVVLGRTGGKYEIASIAPALRSYFPEYRFPELNRRSHGVFVSEMPQETEEEEEHEEEISSDGLDDVEKFLMRMTIATLSWKKTKSESCWRRRGNRNGKKFQRKNYAKVWKTVETRDGSRNGEVPRGSRGAEAENEMQPLRQCGALRERMSTKMVTKLQRMWKRKPILKEK